MYPCMEIAPVSMASDVCVCVVVWCFCFVLFFSFVLVCRLVLRLEGVVVGGRYVGKVGSRAVRLGK